MNVLVRVADFLALSGHPVALADVQDVVRYLVLYYLGGCWFDLDVLFLRSMEPLLALYAHRSVAYAWGNRPHPNGAVFFSLPPFLPSFARVLLFVLERARGFGFLEAELHYDLPLDLLVLPCAWFDAVWMPSHIEMTMENFLIQRPDGWNDTKCSIANFHAHAFAFHWHNQVSMHTGWTEGHSVAS